MISKKIFFKIMTTVKQSEGRKTKMTVFLSLFRSDSIERHQTNDHDESVGKEIVESWCRSIGDEWNEQTVDFNEQTVGVDSSARTPMVLLVFEKSTGQRLARESDEISDLFLCGRILGVRSTFVIISNVSMVLFQPIQPSPCRLAFATELRLHALQEFDSPVLGRSSE